jgi:hypothetical protein
VITPGAITDGAIVDGSISDGAVTDGAVTDGAISEGNVTPIDPVHAGAVTNDGAAKVFVTYQNAYQSVRKAL